MKCPVATIAKASDGIGPADANAGSVARTDEKCAPIQNGKRVRIRVEGAGYGCSWRRIYSVLSFALAAALVCHCMLLGRSAPPRLRGFT
jgi:hypothetical protein